MSTKKEPFYLGGAGSCTAALFTHPLDTLKVRLQVLQKTSTGRPPTSIQMGSIIIRNEGFRSLYNGISASIFRQITYSTARFAFYELLKDLPVFKPEPGKTLPLFYKISLAGIAGSIGGFVGAPADLINVRMQADGRLPVEQRRNYKHAIDGLFRIAREEGPFALWRGAVPVVVRGMFMTAGQLASYDQFKEILLKSGVFKDNVVTHVTASFLAGIVATFVTMPFDVIKTRMQNAAKGVYKGPIDCLTQTVKSEGPMALMRGFTPAYMRLGPHTILTFFFLEQYKVIYKYLS